MLRSMARTTLLAAIAVAGALMVSVPAAQATSDTQPPSVPGAPSASGVTTTLGSLVWAPSTDNTGVTGYTVQILQAGNWSDYTTSTINVARVTGVAAGTTYTFAVVAHDAAGNNSARSQPVTFTTLPYGTGLTCTVSIESFNYGYDLDAAILNMAPTTSNGWKLTFTLPAGTTVNTVFTGVMSRSGDQAAIVNASYSGAIAPGYTIYTGFTATTSLITALPSDFALNGVPCTVTSNG
jgi:chitodextrinase